MPQWLAHTLCTCSTQVHSAHKSSHLKVESETVGLWQRGVANEQIIVQIGAREWTQSQGRWLEEDSAQIVVGLSNVFDTCDMGWLNTDVFAKAIVSGLCNESGQRVRPETEHLKPAAISECVHWVASQETRVWSFPESPSFFRFSFFFLFNVSDLCCFSFLFSFLWLSVGLVLGFMRLLTWSLQNAERAAKCQSDSLVLRKENLDSKRDHRDATNGVR